MNESLPLPTEAADARPCGSSALVTVAITAFERPVLFAAALRSVLEQTYRELDIVVLDNSTSEAIQEIVQQAQDSRIEYIRNEPEVRDSIVVNHRKAFLPRKGRYQIVLSSDCVMRKDAIALMASRLEGDPSIAAVVCDWAKRNVDTGKSTAPKAKLQDLVEHDQNGRAFVDGMRFLERVFESLHGPSVYHTMIATEILRGGLIEPVYYSQAYEHHSGLDLALCKDRIGIIDDVLIHMIYNDERFDESAFRLSPLFNKTVARAKFLEQKFPDLVSRGFDTNRFRLIIVRRFFESALTEPERRLDSLVLAMRHIAPVALAALVLPLVALAAAILAVGRRMRSKRRRARGTSREMEANDDES